VEQIVEEELEEEEFHAEFGYLDWSQAGAICREGNCGNFPSRVEMKDG
jgi:hypothetical protein